MHKEAFLEPDACFQDAGLVDGSTITIVRSNPLMCAVGFLDGSVSIWDRDSDSRVTVKHRCENSISSGRAAGCDIETVAFSQDGALLATGGTDAMAWPWGAATGTALHELWGHCDDVLVTVFSPDDCVVLSGSSDKTACLWDTSTGSSRHWLFGHFGDVLSASFSPDGKTVATASKDYTVWLWSSSSGTALRGLCGHRGPVSSVAFSQDGTRLMTASHDQTVWFWDASTGAALEGIPEQSDLERFNCHSGTLMATAFAHGDSVLTYSGGAVAKLWNRVGDARPYRVQQAFTLPPALVVFGRRLGFGRRLSFSPQGSLIASSAREKIFVVQSASGRVLYSVPFAGEPISMAILGEDTTN